MTTDKTEEVPQWFAMRATYRGELDMKERLEAIGLKAFVPMTVVEDKVRGRKKRVVRPAVSSLIFVFGEKSKIQEFKKTHERLQYMCTKILTTFDGKQIEARVPIVVPDKQMEAFIRLYESSNYDITDNLEIINSIKPGQRVRIIDGDFIGLEGTFQRMKGHRNKRFIVNIEGVVIISTEISPEKLEIIEG